ncbi:MAG TPA: hypothetical protein VJM33_02195 [Microthrixaceae bacterium]|nr:hypothetical protein [Microthrixaceae bacterium]
MSGRSGRTRRWRLTAPLDLVETLGPMRIGRSDPTWLFAGTDVWRSWRTATGTATTLVRVSSGRLEARAWGSEAERVLELVPRLVGLVDDTAGFDPGRSGLIRDAARRHAGMRWGASCTVSTTAVATVLGQRVTAGESISSWRGLVRQWGEPAPGPGEVLGLLVAPDPRTLARLSYSEFHPLGVERGRAETIRRISRVAPRIDALVDEPDRAWILDRIPGVGPWTSSIVRSTALGDPDSPVVGDLHIPGHVCWAIERSRGDDARMLELLAPYAGHRGRAQRLVLWAGARPPRRAPRYRPLPIARM